MKIIVTITLILYAHSDILPINNRVDWSQASLSDLHCPDPASIPGKPEMLEIIPLKTLDYGGIVGSVEGYWCVTEVWNTICEFRWYGPKYITKSFNRKLSTQAQCDESWTNYDDGHPETGGFPPEECSYNNVYTSQTTITLVTPKTVHYDIYSGFVIDPSLQNGYCKSSPCKGVNPGMTWVSIGAFTQSCPPLRDFITSLWHPPIQQRSTLGLESVLRLPSGHLESFSHACQMDLCLQPGILFLDGSWVFIEDGQENIKRLYSYLSPCPSDRKVSIPSDHQAILSEIQTMEHLLWKETCLGRILDIQLTGSLIPSTLMFMTPTRVGRGVGYKIKGNKLYTAPITYARCSNTTTKSDQVYSYSCRDGNHTWEDWSSTSNPNIKHGINGLFLIQGVPTHIEEAIMSNDRHLSEILQLDTHLVEHTRITTHLGHLELGSTHYWTGAMGGDLMDNMKFSWEISLVLLSTLMLSILGICCIIRIPCPKRDLRRDVIPMTKLSPPGGFS